MQVRPLLLTAGILFCFLSVGCDKFCHQTTEDVTTIQNMTGRPLSLSVCKGKFLHEINILVPQDMIANEVSLGDRKSGITMGYGDKCPATDGGKQTMAISLSAASFTQVKLCSDESDTRNVIVETYQSCPTGFLEQVSAEPCGS